jgi:glycosyltransferase involved in cell wall biosynthesis
MSGTSLISDLVSIIIPFHEKSEYLADCLESVRNQSYSNFECILIDNGSEPSAKIIAKKFCSSDNRFRIVDAVGLNLPNALNLGIEVARGSLIARLDSDDEMSEHRIRAQVNEFISDQNLAICGGFSETIGAIESLIHYPLNDLDIKIELLFKSTFCNPTVMFNRNRFDPAVSNALEYDNKYEVAEDYNLFLNSMQAGVFKNLPKVLVKYRIHSNQLTQSRSTSVKKSSDLARLSFIKKNGGSYVFARVHNLMLGGFPFGKTLMNYRKNCLTNVICNSIDCTSNRKEIEIKLEKLIDGVTKSISYKNLFVFLANQLIMKLRP